MYMYQIPADVADNLFIDNTTLGLSSTHSNWSHGGERNPVTHTHSLSHTHSLIQFFSRTVFLSHTLPLSLTLSHTRIRPLGPDCGVLCDQMSNTLGPKVYRWAQVDF